MNGFVYAIESGDAIKIGWSRNPYQRLSELRYAAKKDMRLLGFISAGRKREKELHQEFSAWRIEGEWFKNDGSVAEFAKSLSTDGDNQPEPKGGHMIYVKGAKMTLLTDAELARARALYRDGWTAGTIAFDVGLMTGRTISANTIERYAKRLGWRRASAYEQLLRRKMVK